MKSFLFILFIFLSHVATAQTKGTVTVYAYKQGVAPGAVPKQTMEDGKLVSAPIKPNYNYFTYTASSTTIYPSEIWINKEHFSVSYQKVQSPVEISNSDMILNPTSTVLVPKTSKTVLQVTPKDFIKTSRNNKTSAKLSKSNELVLVYKSKGRFYYVAVKKLKQLQAAAMQ